MVALVVLAGRAGPAPGPVDSASPARRAAPQRSARPAPRPLSRDQRRLGRSDADQRDTDPVARVVRAQPSASKSQPAAGPVIVIDPGHSGRSIRSRTINGLLDFDYPNHPEITEMFDISTCVSKGLRADGYRVILTKKRASDSVSLTERAEIANRAKAALAISVHDDHGQGRHSRRRTASVGSSTTAAITRCIAGPAADVRYSTVRRSRRPANGRLGSSPTSEPRLRVGR